MNLGWIPTVTLIILSCNQHTYTKAEDAQDAGREFIRASLDGDFQKAKFYLLNDSTNLLLLKQHQLNHKTLRSEEKREQHDANIHPVEIKKVNDSITLYKYYNSYNKKDTTTLRIVKLNGEWLVDLKSIIQM